MAAALEKVSLFMLFLLLSCYGILGKSFTRKAKTLTLEDYVKRPDPTYSYREVDRHEGIFHNAYYVNMTSQKWMDETFSDKPVWWHDLIISVPHELIARDVAFLFIGPGSNRPGSIPTPEHDMISAAAQLMSVQMGLTVAVIKQIPNQPIVFKNDPTKKRRTEDRIIAYTWNTFINDVDASPEMLLRYPMTKAVVRAMDTIQEHLRQVAAHTNIKKFVIAGASKRGWTTWTTSAIDKRVVGQMPMVMSLLDFFKNMQKHQSSLGGWTFAFQAYYRENVTMYMDNPRMKDIVSLVDPYQFIDKYTMPTMVVGGTSDQFFLPDDSHLYFSKLPGPKYMLMLPNRDHSLIPFLDALAAMKAFAVGVATKYPFPKVSWELIETATGGKIVFNSSEVKPTHIMSYSAVTATAERRDFRANYGVKAKPSYVFWFEDNVLDEGNGIYVAEFDKPDKGWLGFLIEAVFEGPLGHTLTLTSEVNVIPNTFPYPPCHGDGCYETLV